VAAGERVRGSVPGIDVDPSEAGPVDEAKLRAVAQRILRRLGPMTTGQLAAELAKDAQLVDVPDAGELWQLLLDDASEAFAAFPLSDGRLCDLDHLIDGLTLTHALTAQERSEDALATDPDLEPLFLLTDDDGQIRLADGRLAIDDHEQLTGPAGWLPSSSAVSTRIVNGALEVSGLDDLPEVDATVAERLAETYDLVTPPGRRLDTIELIVELLARFPRTFAVPQAPLGQLLASAGLRTVNGQLVGVDEPDPEPFDPFVVLERHLVEDHGLGDAEVADIRLVHHAVGVLLDRFADAVAAADDLDGEDPLAGVGLDELVREPGSGELAGVPEALARLLTDQELAYVVWEDLVGASALVGVVVETLVEAVDPHLGSRAARANAAWLRAELVQLTGDDHAGAEPLLRRALELDPDHLEATIAIAGYLDDRGQAGAALGYLNRVEGPGLDATRELLTRYARPGPSSAGRNDPCPCGSRRKYKVCCQASNGWSLQDRLDWVWHKVMRFATSPTGASMFEEVVDAAGTDLASVTAEQDVIVTNLALFEGGILDELCELRGALLPADELELLRRWADVWASAQEVVEVAPGAGLTMLDLTTGDRTTVGDRSLSRSLEVGDAVLTWIVPTPEGPSPASGVVRVPDHRRSELLALLDTDPEAIELAGWYASLSAPPGLATTDGDPLVLTSLVYRSPDPDAAWAALADHLEDADDELQSFIERDGQRWLRGSIRREPDGFVVHTNSAVRAAWFTDLVDEVVPDAELIDAERQPAHDLLGRDRGAGVGGLEDDAAGGGSLDLDALDPDARAELEEQLDAMMERHEDAWVDTPLPALEGATPRQAVDDPTRRDAVLRLLDDFERHAAHWDSPGRPMDAARLRRMLGL
jgi:hypothetical protein